MRRGRDFKLARWFTVMEDWLIFGLVAVMMACFWVLMKAEMVRQEMRLLSPKGVAARQEKASRQQEFIQRAGALWQADGTTEEKMKAVVGLMISEYPDIALQLPRMLEKLQGA